jgi:hypothetical protein
MAEDDGVSAAVIGPPNSPVLKILRNYPLDVPTADSGKIEKP